MALRLHTTLKWSHRRGRSERAVGAKVGSDLFMWSLEQLQPDSKPVLVSLRGFTHGQFYIIYLPLSCLLKMKKPQKYTKKRNLWHQTGCIHNNSLTQSIDVKEVYLPPNCFWKNGATVRYKTLTLWNRIQKYKKVIRYVVLINYLLFFRCLFPLCSLEG